MSLARIALRIAAVEAIKGRTLVGANVLDSPNGALDIAADGTLRSDEDRPFISVYTDSGTVDEISGRELTENGLCVLVIEAGISMAMTQTNEETGVSHIVGVGIPASDRNFEFFLDFVQRQVLDALNDPDQPWADIFKGLHYGVTKVEIGGKRNTDDGQRLAGHQTRITVRLIDDPLRGEPLEGDTPFARFLTALQASSDTVYQAQAATMLALVNGTDLVWKTTQRRRGMSRSELLAVGLGPLPQDTERATPDFETAESEVANSKPVTVEPLGWIA